MKSRILRLVPALLATLLSLSSGRARSVGFPAAPQDERNKSQTGCPDIPPPFAVPAESNRFVTPLFEKTTIDKNIVMGEAVNSEGKQEQLLLDVYAPADDAEPRRPALLLIHGGGFRDQTKEQGYIVQLAQAFARRGYVCVSVNYRLRRAPQLDWPGTLKDALDDVMLGLRWIRANAGKHHIDSDHVAIVGGSAGGIIAVNFVARDRDPQPARDRKGIFALIDLWGSPNNPQLRPAGIDACYPPALIIHGTRDETVPFSASSAFADSLNSAGVRNTLLPLPDAPHTPLMHMDRIVEAVSSFLFESLAGRNPSGRR